MAKSVRLLAIDPGACTGWAWFQGGELLRAGVCNADERPTMNVQPWAPIDTPDLLIIEWPNAHETRNASPGKVQDLFRMCIRAGRLEERADALSVRYVMPSDWKGQILKEETMRRVLARLSTEEKARLPNLPKTKAHNMFDAIGIGLFELGRWGR